MKLLLFFILLIPSIIKPQYSNYYKAELDVNENINGELDINQNVNLSGKTKHTIHNIDYGAIALAIAQSEKTRLMKQQYLDEKSKSEALEIASNPVKAFAYGTYLQTNYKMWTNKSKIAKDYGFKKCKFYYTTPHESLFNFTGNGRWENVSENGIKTEYFLYLIKQIKTEDTKNFKLNQAEKKLMFENFKVGQENESSIGVFFLHKKDLNRATICNQKGFKGTLVWEDKYEKTITDTYLAIWQNSEGQWFEAMAKARYSGDKDEVTFEDVEGRRHYLHLLIEKVISSVMISNEVPIDKY